MQRERLHAAWLSWRDRVRRHPWYYKLLLLGGLAATLELAWKAYESKGAAQVALGGLAVMTACGLPLMYRLVMAAERYDDAPAWWYSQGLLSGRRRERRGRS